MLFDREVIDQFHKLIAEAKEYIYVSSAFVKSGPYAPFEELLALFQDAVKKNPKLKIKFVYGMNDQKDDGTYLNKGIEQEKKLCARYEQIIGPALKTKQMNTHGKLVLCDDRCYLIGSANLLSFAGEYDRSPNLHHEVAILSYDTEALQELKKEYFSWE